MRLRALRDSVKVRGKRVLVRIDGNVPFKNGRVEEGFYGRIAQSAVVLEYLRQRGAKVIVLTHVGRPGGKRVSIHSVKPVVRRLSELMGMKVPQTREVVGATVTKMVENMKDGDVLVLENVRFDPRETQNSPALAQDLAALGDIYINDAFSVSHRYQASIDAIAAELPSFAGPTLVREVQTLTKVLKNPRHPSLLMIGGLKMESKVPVMEHLLPEFDHLAVGGALVANFLKAQGHAIGRSNFDDDSVRAAKKLLMAWKEKLIIPTDVLVASTLRKNAAVRVTSITDIKSTERIVDLGSDSTEALFEYIDEAKTIIWNGPFGYCEVSKFCTGTERLATRVAKRTGKALTVVGGGHTVDVLESLRLIDKFTLVSTGGGAMLEFLAGKKLPGLEALKI